MCTDGVWPELTASEMLSTLRAYPLERAVKHMMDHAEFRSGQHGDNLSVVAMRFGEERFDASELMVGNDLGLDGFTTQLRNLGGKMPSDPLSTDNEIDLAMAEIQAALAKYGKN
jgi:serine/threonine protein phosphatase PrpC